MIEVARHQDRVLQVAQYLGELGAGVVQFQGSGVGRFHYLDDLGVTLPTPAVTGGFEEVQAEVWLAVDGFHTGLDLGVYPERGTFLHRAQEEGLEVQEDFVRSLAVPGRLVGDYGGEVSVAATENGIFIYYP